jgi:hypothetical protein
MVSASKRGTHHAHTSLRVPDVDQGGAVASLAILAQRKTQRPVQFEITEAARDALTACVARRGLHWSNFCFPGERQA